jgi:U3 small nucleolar RNA-associated protein 5
MASKKNRTKTPRGRPAATSQISQPAVEDSSFLNTLSSFSPKGDLFAFVSLAVDKHCLHVYDTTSACSIADHVVDSARVMALAWSNFDISEGQQPSVEDNLAPPIKKKRKKGDSHVADTHVQAHAAETVVLGLSNGTLLLFSPSHGRVLRNISHVTSTSAILSAVMAQIKDKSPVLWTSGADGAIRLWDARKNDMLGSWKIDDRIPYSSIAVRPGSATEGEDCRVELLIANHGIQLLSTNPGSSEIDTTENCKPIKLASFTGHASPITSLHWDTSQKPANRFLSTAEGDRFVCVWEVPSALTGSVKEGKLVASIPLDSHPRCLSLSIPPISSTSTVERQTLITLSASGKISVLPIPSELTPPASSKKAQQKVPILFPRSSISLSSKRTSSAQVVAVSFVSQAVGRIRYAAIIGGARPVFGIIVSGSFNACDQKNLIL